MRPIDKLIQELRADKTDWQDTFCPKYEKACRLCKSDADAMTLGELAYQHGVPSIFNPLSHRKAAAVSNGWQRGWNLGKVKALLADEEYEHASRDCLEHGFDFDRLLREVRGY